MLTVINMTAVQNFSFYQENLTQVKSVPVEIMHRNTS